MASSASQRQAPPFDAVVSDWFSFSDPERIKLLSSQDGNYLLARGAFGELSIGIDTSGDGWSLAAIKTIQRATVPEGGGFDSWGRGAVSLMGSSTSNNQQQLTPEVFNELAALRLLNPHPCIVPFLGIAPSSRNQRSLPGELSLAFSYNPVDLHMILDRQRKLALPPLSFNVTKAITKDIMLAVKHCHSQGVIHRDIKPGNLLISPQGRVQICDFGLAKPCPSLLGDDQSGPEDPPGVSKGLCTLQYRPPEILLGGSFCEPSGDIYSVGLVLAELLLGIPLFSGKNVLDQLGLTFQVLGTHWPDSRFLPDYGKVLYPSTSPQPWTQVIPRICECPLLENLFSNVVALDPRNRWSASESLQHEWFASQPHAISSQQLADELIPVELDVPRVLFSSPAVSDETSDGVAKKRVAAVAAARRAYSNQTHSKIWKREEGEAETLPGRYRQLHFNGGLTAALQKRAV